MRIEIPVYMDAWMRGARFGEVIKTDRAGVWHVKMDHPQVTRLLHIPPHMQVDCKIISTESEEPNAEADL